MSANRTPPDAVTPDRWEIARIKVGDRFRQDPGDLKSLAESIEEDGLFHPIVIKPDGTLIAGLRRLKACESLGWPDIPVTVIDTTNPVRIEHDENRFRKDFTLSESVAIMDALWQEEVDSARARQRSGLRQGQITPVCETFADGGGRTWDRLGRYVHLSGATAKKAKAVVQAEMDHPGRPEFARLVEEMDAKGKVDGAYRKLQLLESGAAPTKPQGRAEDGTTGPAEVKVRHWAGLQDTLPEFSDVDLVVTAPFLTREQFPLYGELAQFAKRVLKPEGALAVMCPNEDISEVLSIIKPQLPFRRTIAYLKPGSDSWNPVLVFGAATAVTTEIIRARGKSDACGRSEPGLAALIEALTVPGDLVADPFTGNGVTGLACARIKPARRFTGADTSPENVKRLKERVRKRTGYFENLSNLHPLKKRRRRVRSPLRWR